MSFALAVLFPLIGVGICVYIVKRWPVPDDRKHLMTSDNPEAQAKKLLSNRYRYVRKDGFWYQQRAVSHGSLTLRVEEPVKRS